MTEDRGAAGAGEGDGPLRPVEGADRIEALDVLRGVALLGVLLVNLLSDFRIPLAEHLLRFHTATGHLDRLVDVLVAAFLEFKAITLFSLLFGAGLGGFDKRAAARGAGARLLLARRLAVLLGIGLAHMLLVWNGDILTLYAACGLLLLPVLRLPVAAQVVAGVVAAALPWVVDLGPAIPDEDALRSMAAEARGVYARGSYAEVLAFHRAETRQLIIPLLLGVLPRTLGVMLLGLASWRAGVVRDPPGHRGLLWVVAIAGGVVGGSATALHVASASTGSPSPVPGRLLDAASSLPLALAYASILLLAGRGSRGRPLVSAVAAVGRMALTNYLAQSLALGLIFYGYGLGWSGHLGSAPAALVGLALYAGQLAFSSAWLRRYRFGPAEWAWRSLTYGRRQPMRRAVAR